MSDRQLYTGEETIYHLSSEDFWDVWDYVSMEIVDEEVWEKNLPFIKQLTFDMYEFEHKRNGCSLKHIAKRLEIIFQSFDQEGVLNIQTLTNSLYEHEQKGEGMSNKHMSKLLEIIFSALEKANFIE